MAAFVINSVAAAPKDLVYLCADMFACLKHVVITIQLNLNIVRYLLPVNLLSFSLSFREWFRCELGIDVLSIALDTDISLHMVTQSPSQVYN